MSNLASALKAFPRPQQIVQRASIPFWLGLGVVLLLAMWLHWTFADPSSLSSDEATHLMWLRLIEAGYTPYSEVYITYPPLFHLFLIGSWRLSSTLTGLYWFSFAYAFLSVVVSAIIVRRIKGNLAGIATAALLAIALGPGNILSEEPSISWSLFAVLFALIYRDTGRRWLLILSAITLAFSFLTKLQSPFIPAVIIFIIFLRFFKLASPREFLNQWRVHWRTFTVDVLLWGSAAILPFVLIFIFFDLASFLHQGVWQHVAARAAFLDDENYWTFSMNRLRSFVVEHTWLIPLAFFGLFVTFAYKTKDRGIFVLWFILAAATMLYHRPVRSKHFIVFLPLLAIWAGIATSQIWLGINHFKKLPTWSKGVTILGLSLLAAYLLYIVPILVEGWQTGPILAGPSNNNQAAANFIDKVTLSEDCLITDNINLAYWSGRQVPPELAEISSNRFISGYLTRDLLVEISNKYDCQIVATSSRIARFTPDFKKWVGANYLGRFHFDDRELYVAKVNTTPNPSYPMAVELGNAIRFLGYSVETQNPKPGGALTLVLYWESLALLDVDYTIFVHLRDSNNVSRVGADHQPYEGAAPTTRWKVGAVIKDVVKIDIPADLPPGEYQVAVGMYRLDTLERLPVTGDTSGENAIILKNFYLGD